jgi:Cysteine-rich CWC
VGKIRVDFSFVQRFVVHMVKKSTLTPLNCPLCGSDNACVMQSASPGSACWCQDAQFSEGLLARVPEAAKRKVCICAKCARAAAAAKS